MNKTFYPTLIALFLLSSRLFAQTLSAQAWGGGADQKDLSFGFSFSSVSSYYKIDKNPNWQAPFLDPVNGNKPLTGNGTSISSNYSTGFGVGFLTRYRLNEFLEARVTPTLVFTDKMLTYTYDTSPAI